MSIPFYDQLRYDWWNDANMENGGKKAKKLQIKRKEERIRRAVKFFGPCRVWFCLGVTVATMHVVLILCSRTRKSRDGERNHDEKPNARETHAHIHTRAPRGDPFVCGSTTRTTIERVCDTTPRRSKRARNFHSVFFLYRKLFVLVVVTLASSNLNDNDNNNSNSNSNDKTLRRIGLICVVICRRCGHCSRPASPPLQPATTTTADRQKEEALSARLWLSTSPSLSLSLSISQIQTQIYARPLSPLLSPSLPLSLC